MLISHRYGFIYTKTAKTAGTSVESFFERFCMPNGAWQLSHTRDQYVSPEGIIGCRRAVIPQGTTWWNHMPASAIRQLIGQEVWDRYFKFCVIRNPFEKCISAFCHLGQHHQLPGYAGLYRPLRWLRDERPNFQQSRFISYLKNEMKLDRDAYMIDGEFCMDYYIRYESLEADIKHICKHIGVEYDARFLPSFKSGIRSKRATVDALYTDESRAWVERTFAIEMQHFGYSYPVSGDGNEA